MLPLQGAWVHSLIREIRSLLSCSASKKKSVTLTPNPSSINVSIHSVINPVESIRETLWTYNLIKQRQKKVKTINNMNITNARGTQGNASWVRKNTLEKVILEVTTIDFWVWKKKLGVSLKIIKAFVEKILKSIRQHWYPERQVISRVMGKQLKKEKRTKDQVREDNLSHVKMFRLYVAQKAQSLKGL